MMEAMLISRYFPALGDPWRLTLAQWNAVMDRMADVIEWENPGDSEQQAKTRLKQMLRKKRRQEARRTNG